MAEIVDRCPDSERDLVLERILDAPRSNVWRCWTESGLFKRWFAPIPFETVSAEIDPRPGGGCRIVMTGPDGTEYPSQGVYLAVEPQRRLVFTDAFISAWVPSEKPFMAVTVILDDASPGRTRYTAIARHWTVADREAHQHMGFHEGWSQCAEQLEKLAAGL